MADAGLCLHQSASGFDLPMKLADFRGAGIPVCAYDYAPVLSEVLTPGHEGVTFRDPGELASLFVALARADLGKVPQFAAARTWLAANPAGALGTAVDPDRPSCRPRLIAVRIYPIPSG